MLLHGATETLAVHGTDDSKVLAQASIWVNGTAALEGQKTGVVGHFAAVDERAGGELLAEAVERLRRFGCERVVGPMDGTTWRRYRLVTEVGDEPAFFMEPQNPVGYIKMFTGAGFVPLAQYYSSLDATLDGDDTRVEEVLPNLKEQGIRIRDIKADRFEEELGHVHELSLEAFAGNFMYSPISREEFVASYAAARKVVMPGMVLMAENSEGALIGFMFTMPDVKNPELRTAIAKTVAVRPGLAGAGLGSVLLELTRRAARQHGFQRLIYALMHESNRSTRMAQRFGKKFRGYTLYEHMERQ